MKPFKPIKYKGRPIWAADAETDPFKKGRVPKPFIWGIYTGDQYFNPSEIYGCITQSDDPVNYLEFTDTEAFIIFVQEHNVIIYAHNGGKFDWHFITDYISDYEKLTVIAGRLAKFEIGYCEFRDSYNIIPAPLSAYKKDDIDYNLFEIAERNKSENWQKIRNYLKSDCIYLHEMIVQFVENYGMSLTQAGAAMKVWSKISGISKPQTSPTYYDEMSKYYYGGRVECFQTGIIEREFKVVDINSAYPYAMTFLHPWGGYYSTLDKMPADITDDELSRCFITLDAESLGAFPIREKTGLNFPNDKQIREFHVTGWEYIAARDTDTLKSVNIKRVLRFVETIEFRDYVAFFWALKDEAAKTGDAAMYLFAKLFLNSLYGKFASNPENYEEFMTVPGEFIAASREDGWSYCKMISTDTAVMMRPLEEEKRRYYDVSVAASITGFVRAYLWRNICATNGTVIYCDTDSIAASDVDRISKSKALGDWDVEALCDFGAVAGKKLYAFRRSADDPDAKKKPWKTATKGVRLSHTEIVSIARGNTVIYEPDAPTFSIKRGITFTPRTIKMLENA